MIPVLYTTFNRLDYTRQTLPVLLENTQEGTVIVIDNGSTDGTVNFLKSLSGFDLILKEENTGISGAMNTFFEMTEGEKYVAKVDNDTIVPAGGLSDLQDILILAKLEIVQAAHYFFSTLYEDCDALMNKRPSRKVNDGNIVYTKIVGGSGIVFKREIITEPLKENGLYGWGNFQYQHREHRRGMYDGVWIDLLDMAGYNLYKGDIDKEYFLSTGRLRKRD